MLIPHATVSMILFLILALLIARGLRMADCLSRLITTVTNAQEYIACSLRNISSLQAKSPASHWTVMFHTASTGITMKVTSRSATVRLIISTLTWDFLFPSLWAAHSTARLHKADKPQRMKVMVTLTLAAVVNVGSCMASPPAVQLEAAGEQLQLALAWWSSTRWNMVIADSLREVFIFCNMQRKNHPACPLQMSALVTTEKQKEGIKMDESRAFKCMQIIKRHKRQRTH